MELHPYLKYHSVVFMGHTEDSLNLFKDLETDLNQNTRQSIKTEMNILFIVV